MDAETSFATIVRYGTELLAAMAWPLLVVLTREHAVLDGMTAAPFVRSWAFLYSGWWIARSVSFPCYANAYDARKRQSGNLSLRQNDTGHFVVEVVWTCFAYFGTFALALRHFGADTVFNDALGFSLTLGCATLVGALGACLAGALVGAMARSD